MCCRVLPMWEGIASPEQAQILTLLAELCMFTAQISNPLMAAENVYKLLLVRHICFIYTASFLFVPFWGPVQIVA